MGHFPLTPRLVYLLSAIYKALTTCTTTLLRSLGGPGGGFDIPKSKCPPDRGSPDCVTGRPASISSNSSFSSSDISFSSLESSIPLVYPPTPPLRAGDYVSFTPPYPISLPQAIPTKARAVPPLDLATPPMTPDDDDDSDNGSNHDGRATTGTKDALDFLLSIFSRDGMNALPFAKSVTVSSPDMGADFDGVVLDLPGRSKTLYVDGKSAAAVSLRESIVALLDLADERLQCTALVIALERSSPVLGDLLHSFMYVGGTVVTKPPFQVDSAYVLVGMEI